MLDLAKFTDVVFLALHTTREHMTLEHVDSNSCGSQPDGQVKKECDPRIEVRTLHSEVDLSHEEAIDLVPLVNP